MIKSVLQKLFFLERISPVRQEALQSLFMDDQLDRGGKKEQFPLVGLTSWLKSRKDKRDSAGRQDEYDLGTI